MRPSGISAWQVLPALRAPECASRLFTDHATLALAAHAAQAYGEMQTLARPLKGGLAPWQERRSKEMIAGDLTGATPLRDIAEACGLSVSHFSRAFRRSTGHCSACLADRAPGSSRPRRCFVIVMCPCPPLLGLVPSSTRAIFLAPSHAGSG
jgi:AraC-like DNA-binding protein